MRSQRRVTLSRSSNPTFQELSSTGKGVVKVRQIGSPIRWHYRQGLTLRGLGLNRIGRIAELPNTPQVWGMIARVSHLVRVVGCEAVRRKPMRLKIDFVRDFADINRLSQDVGPPHVSRPASFY